MTFHTRNVTTLAAVLLSVVGCDNPNVVGSRTLQDTGGNGPQQSNTGTSSGGGSIGGAATGGASPSGGVYSTGGASPSGGTNATGGTSARGGVSATGGASPSGGVYSTGGASPSGGVYSTGGASPSGGTNATGGTSARGGVSATGGATDICLLPIPDSTCAAALIRYHYNAATGICEVFNYGGCGGNDNNFDTQQECESRCSPRQTGTGGSSGTGGSAGTTGCSEVPVWTQQSQGFEIASSGGMVEPPPADAGCANTYTHYGFSFANRTLTEDGCDFKGRLGYVVHLTQAGLDSVVAGVSALHSTCKLTCGADAPNETLTIQSAGPAVVYTSNFYAGCSYTTPPLSPPFISYEDLWSFVDQLNKFVADACDPVDAGGTTLGTCG